MNGPGLLSAAAAGVLSFLSPCVLPLIPAYLSFISGATASELSARSSRAKVFIRSLAFSAGFTLAFTILGIVFSGGAMFVGRGSASKYIGIAGGILVVILGLNLLFDFIKLLDADTRFIGRFSGKKAHGSLSAIVLGFAFAAGWSPCIGPILASILLFAGREGNIPRAAALLFSYSLGFALPFLATGLFFDRLKPLLSFFSKHGKAVRSVSGIVLILFGIAMAAGSLGSLSAIASKAGYGLEAFIGKNQEAARLIGAGIWVAIGFAFGIPVLARTKRGIAPKWGMSAIGGSLSVALAIAELLGVFSTLSLVAGWLTFAGI
ncbi:MAG: cytochrome c biogenesis protein CcdA [Spirochaetales bacterium]|jgi:cytochrome c-type biogenesis protein